MSRCDKYMEMASAHLDGELSREETRELLEHLEQCSECRRFYETIKMFSDETGVTEAPEGFAEGVMNALRPAEGEKAAPKKRTRKKFAARYAALAACLALVAAAGVKMLLPAASDERPESEAAGFNVTGAQYEAPGSNAVEDRDIENYDLAPGGETEAPASGDDCVAEIRSVTVTCGNVTAYFDEAAEIDELAAIFAYGGEASGLPGEQADYILTIEGESRSVQLRAWESDGALLCELDGGRTWKAAGTAAELEKLAG